MEYGRIRFAPTALSRLGEELIPNPEQGIIELAKNSYDAEASYCNIQLINSDYAGGSIIITDDGYGMTIDSLINDFLVIGSSLKKGQKFSPYTKRKLVGSKGLGRLAALRLGYKCIITSRSIKSPGIEAKMTIDWKLIDQSDTVDDVKIYIETFPTSLKPGTTIEILDLKKPFNRKDAWNLARECILLCSPFEDTGNFEVSINSKDYDNLISELRGIYLKEADYLLEANLKNKKITYKLIKFPNQIISTEEYDDTNLPDLNIDFRLWTYLMSGDSFSLKTIKLTETRNWLKSFGGIYIYHNKVRARPYGDQGFDWLDLNQMRARSPEETPSTNTVVGRLNIDDPNDLLDQPTSRFGFIEDEVFNSIREFGREAIRWMTRHRMRLAIQRRQERKEAETKKPNEVAQEVNNILLNAQAPKKVRGEIQEIITKELKTTSETIIYLKEELQFYRSLATAGVTAAIFSHEIEKPITEIEKVAESFQERITELYPQDYEVYFSDLCDILNGVSQNLKIYATFPMYHLQRSKREVGSINLVEIWNSVKKHFSPILRNDKFSLEISSNETNIFIYGSISLVEAIATNLITNSIKAINRNPNDNERKITVDINLDNDVVTIIHRDSGEGIVNIEIEDIWSPGFSYPREGTGFGLTIVKDSIGDLKGKISANKKSPLGGAEFIIKLPRYIFPEEV